MAQTRSPLYFEGKITFNIEVTPTTDRYQYDILRRVAGTISEFYYKEANERIKNPDAVSIDMIYRVPENKVYTQRVGNDTVYWEFCGVAGSKVLNYTLTPRKEVVLGILCDELTIEFDNRTVTSYFNSDTLKINPDLHKARTLGNDDFTSEKKKALSLKFIIRRSDYIITYTATSISHEKLADDTFFIPAGKPMVEWR